MTDSVSLLTAMAAGLVSFISPCVLPIVPGYLSFISGVNMAELRGGEAPRGVSARVGLTSFVFVLGFSSVFIALGAPATLVGATLQAYKRELGMIGGAIIIVLDLHTAVLLPIKVLVYEKRVNITMRAFGLLGADPVCPVFAFS